MRTEFLPSFRVFLIKHSKDYNLPGLKLLDGVETVIALYADFCSFSINSHYGTNLNHSLNNKTSIPNNLAIEPLIDLEPSFIIKVMFCRHGL